MWLSQGEELNDFLWPIIMVQMWLLTQTLCLLKNKKLLFALTQMNNVVQMWSLKR